MKKFCAEAGEETAKVLRNDNVSGAGSKEETAKVLCYCAEAEHIRGGLIV